MLMSFHFQVSLAIAFAVFMFLEVLRCSNVPGLSLRIQVRMNVVIESHVITVDYVATHINNSLSSFGPERLHS
jgi:hypothetical protein